jgi:PAS domain S-box-containing protein
LADAEQAAGAMMDEPMNILILEDDAADAELVKRELRKAGFDFTSRWAQDKASFVAALETSAPDLVLADYSLPGFDGLTALRLARQRWADVPVVIVSGAIGEELAIDTLKAGATDYVLKQRLSRLGPVVHRALAEARERAQKRRTEEALRQSEERFRLLVEGVQDYAILMLDPQGRIASWNTGAQRLKGWSGPEVLGRDFSLFYTPEDRASGHPQWTLEQAAAEGRYEEQGERVRKNGQRFWADVVITALRDESGQLYGFAKITRDVTERRRAEEALREANTTLESKVAQRTAELEYRARQLQKLTFEVSEAEDRERKRLAEILHDDLQQVLAAAKFHLSLLNSRLKRDPSQQAIAAEVEHLLLDAIQKSRSLSHELSPAVLSHGTLAETLGWLAAQVRTNHGLQVTVDSCGETAMQSDSLKTFLYKAAQELLFNVVKHARVNEARIRVRRLGRCIGLAVSDQGRGFDPRELRRTTGFGLLSIGERVELLGGRMRIRSRTGEGSTFLIIVPDRMESDDGSRPTEDRKRRAEKGGPPLVLDPSSAHHPLRVLLADDHDIVREGLASLLSEEKDIEVVGEAANGREAVNQAYRLEPDVVIMDVAMPLINGDGATRQIKLRLPKTRVIALSMYEEADAVERMRRAGAERYVLKTAPAQELLAAIRGTARDP